MTRPDERTAAWQEELGRSANWADMARNQDVGGRTPGPLWQVWLRYAEDDLGAARLLRSDHPAASVFHAQQAAEKAAKALWVWSREQDPPRMHDVAGILEQFGAARTLLDAGADLTDAYFASRYPPFIGEPVSAEVSPQEAADRLKDAEEILRWVRHKLPTF